LAERCGSAEGRPEQRVRSLPGTANTGRGHNTGHGQQAGCAHDGTAQTLGGEAADRLATTAWDEQRGEGEEGEEVRGLAGLVVAALGGAVRLRWQKHGHDCARWLGEDRGAGTRRGEEKEEQQAGAGPRGARARRDSARGLRLDFAVERRRRGVGKSRARPKKIGTAELEFVAGALGSEEKS